jgi:hypothetical protein
MAISGDEGCANPLETGCDLLPIRTQVLMYLPTMLLSMGPDIPSGPSIQTTPKARRLR